VTNSFSHFVPLTWKSDCSGIAEKLSARDFYGKVVKRLGEKGQTHMVHFTSVPSEVDAYFQALLQYNAK
jgi:hypothetical protein